MGDLSAEVSEENRVAAQEDKGKAVKAISEGILLSVLCLCASVLCGLFLRIL